MEQHATTFLKATLAGMMIAIGATAYLTISNPYVGAILFTIGLFTIYTLDFYLFTGKVGYFFQDKDILKLIIIWLGNLTGVLFTATLLLQTRIVTTTTLLHHAEQYAAVKLGDTLISVFILGVFCGLLMYIGAQSFKSAQHTTNSVGGYIGLFLCVMVFLLLGFEHSIANMFYFTVAEAWSWHCLVALLVVTAGNTLGGLLPTLLFLPIKKTCS